MSEDKTKKDENKAEKKQATVAKPFLKKKKKNFKKQEQKDEFDQRVLDLARVTRVMAGGKRMRFRACVAVGDKKGRIGVGMGKGADVTIAINKAVNRAKKDLLIVPIVNETIPHEVLHKFGASKILFKPAGKGRGVIAGGIVRVILELAGIHNVSSKILGTNNKVTNAKCTIEALSKLKKVENKDKKEKPKAKEDKKPEKVEEKAVSSKKTEESKEVKSKKEDSKKK